MVPAGDRVCGAPLLVTVAACSPSPQPLGPGPALDATYASPPAALSPESGPGPPLRRRTANDDNPGTEQAPFRTIEQAAYGRHAGDDGDRGRRDLRGRDRDPGERHRERRIVFVAATKWGAKLVGREDDDDAVWRNYGDYVDIQGFDVFGDSSARHRDRPERLLRPDPREPR
jgi:hypothetical protein